MKLLKKALSLSRSAKHSKNGILTKRIWKTIIPKDISRIIIPMDEVFPIPKTKFANPAFILSSFIGRTLCRILNYSLLPVDLVAISESINRLLNP